MRILTYGLSTDKLAGIETFLLNMNKYMSEDCIFDYVIERNADIGEGTIHQEAIDAKGGKVYYISPKRKMLQNVRDWRQLLQEHGNEYSVVYFNMYSLSWFIPIALCKQNGLKVFVHSHNAGIHNCGIVLKTLHQIGRQLLRCMDIERLTNSRLSSQFMFCDADAGRLICNAISLERFCFDKTARIDMRSRLNCSAKSIYGFCGRLVYEKNLSFLVEVFDRIQKKDDKAALLIIGSGAEEAEIRQDISNRGIADKVLFTGNVTNVEAYYQAMDVFLLPSLYEGLGLVLVEAQATGLPCITSAGVVPQEAKVTELLEYVPLSEPDEWVNTAIEMAGRTIERGKYRSIIANSGFNIETEAKRLEEILVM